MSLRLGLEMPYHDAQDRASNVDLARAAEANGFDAVWVSELYSYDCFTTLTHLACNTTSIGLGTNIANMYARTPAMLASTAASLDQLSGGRLRLGLGVSGPQVIEGWHGVAYDKPIQRTREVIEITRTILRGERLNYTGEIYNVTKGLKLINKGQRPDVPILVASLGPKNVEMTAECADGWLPTWFSTIHAERVFGPQIDAGLARAGKDRSSFDVMPLVPVFAGDVQTGINAGKFVLGFYIGGMGSKKRNFYKELAVRYGYEAEADKIQELFLGGDKQAAIMAVPDELVDEVSAIGDEARLRDRLKAFEAAGATGIIAAPLAGNNASRIAILETLARANQ